jgi:hypothetical protein
MITKLHSYKGNKILSKIVLIGTKALIGFITTLLILGLPGLSLKADDQPWSPVKIPGPEQHPPELLKLATEFRSILGWGNGVPDFASIVEMQKEKLPEFRARLDALDTTDWSVHYKVDYLLLRSEMDALEFDLYIWRSTSRDPSFYVNQAIAHVNRHLVGSRYLGMPQPMPYSKEKAKAILQTLADTEQFLVQGRKNLTEMVPELADIALRHPGGGYYTEGVQLKYIKENYEKWAKLTAEHFPKSEAKKLVPAAIKAAEHLLEFGKWLEKNREKMTGKYYISQEIYDWYLRHVCLMPFNSDQIRLLAEMERAKSLAYFQFETHKNRHLPPIKPANTTKEYLAWDDETTLILRRWYLEKGEDLLSDRDYMAEIRSEEGLYLPPFGFIAFPYDEKPGIFRILVVPADHWRAIYSNMGFRTDPAVLHGHEYWPGHYYEGQVWRHSPCPIRNKHRDRHHIGSWCYWHEMLPVALDFPFVRGPRARELPYLNMLQRAERILTGFDLLTGKITPEEAFRLYRERIPPLGSGLGVTREEAFEEMEGVIRRGLDHCVTGKFQIFKALADRKMQLKEKFNLKEFYDHFVSLGPVPFSLLRWEILGLDDEAKKVVKPVRLSSILK